MDAVVQAVLDWLSKHFAQEQQVITSAPVAFIVCVGLVGLGAFFILRWHFKHELSARDGTIRVQEERHKLKDERLATFLSNTEGMPSLDEVRGQLAMLRSELIETQRHDVPSLSIHSRGWVCGPDTISKKVFLQFYIEILNQGAPTSLHDWHGSFTLNNGSSGVLSDQNFDPRKYLLDQNLISDDRTIDRNGRRLGWVRFPLSEEAATVMQRVTIKFRDHTNVVHSVESDVRLKAASKDS